MSPFLAALFVCTLALILDHLFGEPRRWHPLVGFGWLANKVEKNLNRSPGYGIGRGFIGVVLLVAPLTLLVVLLEHELLTQWLRSGWITEPVVWLIQALILWLALSLRGLAEHGRAVANALNRNDLPDARHQVGRIVSRETSNLNHNEVAAAASESMLENGADAVFASLFWFLVAGLPGVVLHRLVNTLDAMWGYRTERFLTFGRVAARLDDLMNWLPARMTALTYTLLGNTRTAWRCWRTQAPRWDSPNAGPVMAAGAGALGVSLGGPAPYKSGLKQRPTLGAGPLPTAATIVAAIALVQRGAWCWVGLLALITVSTILLPGVLP